MVLNVTISSQAEAMLKAKAAAAGVDVETYVSSLVEEITKAPFPLKQISGSIAEHFAKSGMTEDELSDFLEAEKHAMRTERRDKQSR